MCWPFTGSEVEREISTIPRPSGFRKRLEEASTGNLHSLEDELGKLRPHTGDKLLGRLGIQHFESTGGNAGGMSGQSHTDSIPSVRKRSSGISPLGGTLRTFLHETHTHNGCAHPGYLLRR